MTTTGFLHPGAMGSTIGAACSGETYWVSAGRSTASHTRAAAAELRDAGSLPELVATCDTIVSVCPPDRAMAVAHAVATAGFDGTYVDANAVSPMTTREIGALFDRYVDGGIIGPPADRAGTTRMYLSGDEARAVATRWDGSLLDVRPIEGGVGAASAVKMLFAGWTKGTGALLLALNAAADAYGVSDALNAEWAISIPDLPDRSQRTASGTGPKAWRFEGEMHEIAATLAASDLPAGFHLSAAEIYRRIAVFKDAEPPPGLDAVIAALLDG